MMYQIEYQLLPSKTIRYYIFKVKTKKEAEHKLYEKYNTTNINILNIEKI